MATIKLRKLIREEVRKALGEHNVQPYAKKAIIYKLKPDTSNSMYLVIYTSNDDDYFGFDELPFTKVSGTNESNFVILYKLDNASKGVIKALGNRLPEVQSPQQVGSFKDDEEFVLANPSDLIEVPESILKEEKNILKGVKIKTGIFEFPESKLIKLFGSFLAVKPGSAKRGQYSVEYVADLDVDALVSLLKSNKDYSTLNPGYAINVSYKGNDMVSIDAKGLPKDVISTLVAIGEKDYNTENLVSLQVSDQSDFENPEELYLPAVVQSAVGEFSPSADPEDDDAYSDEIDRYLSKVEKALLVLGKKAVPGMKKYAKEDGYVIFQLPTELDAQTQSKLKTVFKGVKSIKF